MPTTQQTVEVLINTIAYQHYLLSAASAGVIFYSRDSTAFTSAVAAEEGFFRRKDFFRTAAARSSEFCSARQQ